MDNLVQGNNVDFYAGISTEPINDELLDGFVKMYKPKKVKKSDKDLLDIDWDNVKANKKNVDKNDIVFFFMIMMVKQIYSAKL